MSLSLLLLNFFLFGILSISFFVKAKITSPIVIVFSLWLFLFLFYTFGDLGMYPLSTSVLRVFFSWLLSFFIGGVLANKIPVARETEYMVAPGNTRRFFFQISLMSVPFLCYKIIQIGSGGVGSFLFNLRASAIGLSSEGDEIGIIKYIAPIALLSFLAELFHYNKSDKSKRLYVLLAINILYVLFYVSKTGIFYLIIPSIVVLIFKNRVRFKQIFLLALLLFCLLSVLQLSRGNGSEDAITVIGDMFKVYIFGGMPAMDQFLQENPSSGLWGEHIFSSMYKLLNLFGAGFEMGQGKGFYGAGEGYAEVPYLTNVFTVVCFFYQDFGAAGVAFFGCLTGFLTSLMFRLAWRKHSWAVIVYAHLATSLILQFFGDLIFTMLSQTIQIFLISYLIYHVNIKHRFCLIRKSRLRTIYR